MCAWLLRAHAPKRSNLKGALQPFAPAGLASAVAAKSKPLRSAEAVSLALPLSGITLYSGLYVNELISRVLEHETRFSELFFDYLHCIQALAGASGSPEPALRRFELALLGHLGVWRGFSPLRRSGEPVDDTMTYRYREEKGFIASLVIDNNTFTGHHLKALASREFPDVDTLRAAKALYPYRPEALSRRQTAQEPGSCFASLCPARKARADNTNND